MTYELEKYPPGSKLDWVPRGDASGAPGGDHGTSVGPHALGPKKPEGLILPGTPAATAFNNATQTGQGRRYRVTVDKKMSDGRYRVILDDTLDTAWVEESELEGLDAITRLGDTVGPRGRSLEDALSDIVDDVHICHDCEEPIQGTIHWMGKQARCDDCRNKKLGLT